MTQKEKMEFIDNLSKEGKLTVTKDKIFGSDFQTPDGKFSFVCKRRGSVNYYEIKIEGKTTVTADFNKALNVSYDYLKDIFNEEI